MNTLKLEQVPIDKLVPYARNARTHSKEQIAQLRASLREFGFVSPAVIDADYNILVGHGRIEAARAEGYETVPCVFAENLSESQKRAYILADNQLALNAGWDEEMLSVELSDLQDSAFDLSLLGFGADELETLLDGGADKDAEGDDFDLTAALEKASFVERGDIWTVGKHRLMCGDATSADEMIQNKLTLGSLFDGSGGFPLGGLISGITPVWSSEIEPFPVRVTTKRLPFMKHYGDVSAVNGAELSPVDIITFSSPCQDMSIVGKREGLSGSRSNLFYEAVRIVKEMRCATDGKYPRYIVWENVPGAFSSNKGDDFKAVLEAVCSVKGGEADIARPAKWPNAGEILADDYSVAWRVFDAQYWGVPQRRKRIYLVADFDGGSAGKILFESEGLSGYTPQGFRSWQDAPRDAGKGSAEAGGLCLNDQGGERMDVTEDVACTLRAEAHHPPVVMESAGFCTEHSAKSRSIGYEEEKSPTLRAEVVPAAVMFENHSQDTRYTGPLDVAQTVLSTFGTGGNNQPFIVENAGCFDVRFTSDGSKVSRGHTYPTDTARTVDTGGNAPDSNQGGVAYGIDRATYNMGQNAQFDIAIREELEPTIVAKGPGAVAHPVYSTSKNSYHTEAEEDLVNTLVATDYKDPPTITEDPYNIVRRLTPVECARLQGFPDWWCSDLGTENPTDEDISFWRDVFETHRKVMGTSSKQKTDAQIIKWLKDPHSDSAEYKLWGNGVALPCVCFVLAGIVYCDQLSRR